MKFNLQLKHELRKYEKISTAKSSQKVVAIRKTEERPQPGKVRSRPSEKVVGGDILWKPIDRPAAMLLAKAPWYAHPPQIATPGPEPKKKQAKRRKKRNRVKDINYNAVQLGDAGVPANCKYTAKSGLTVRMINGEAMFDLDELHQFLCNEISKMPQEARPTVRAAEDARKTVTELLRGIGGEMEKFKADSALYLNDIRQTRFAVVTETAQMTKELKDVRQFFLGSDYKEQTDRLREFVDLCERLQKLKESGFLDSVADTMIRLADK